MRVLITIPHYFGARAGATDPPRHGSTDPAKRTLRRDLLDRVIGTLHDLFGEGRYAARHQDASVCPAPNPLRVELTIAVFTAGDHHLLADLACPPALYQHHGTAADPQFLGWECHAHLRDRLGEFDYYCYLEDDILILDPLFFLKLNMFNDNLRRNDALTKALLQPQRYETSLVPFRAQASYVRRIYMDYQTAEADAVPRERLGISLLGQGFEFERTTHPHAGCFFLAAEQMAHLAAQPGFLDRSEIYMTPLDTAATRDIARNFRVFKTALNSLSFFEVCHGHAVMLEQLFPGEDRVPAWRP
jgi:hypothetical protein